MMNVRTYQKSHLIGEHDPFYTEFYDEILQKEFHLKHVKEKGDLILIPLFPPHFKATENAPKKIYVLGENIYISINKPMMKVLHLFGRFRIPVRFIPDEFKKMCGITDRWRLRLFGIKQIQKLARQPNTLLIGTNAKGKISKMIPFPFFIPCFYRQFHQFLVKREANKATRFCCIIFSNLGGDTLERVKFMQQLSKYKPVDCFGKTPFSNATLPKNMPPFWWQNIPFLSQYKFVICFENSFQEDYITEKLPNALLSGAIAIYRGAPNVKDYFNTKAFINFDNFGSYQKMIGEIIEIDSDNQKHEQYLAEPIFSGNQIPLAITEKVTRVKKSMQDFVFSESLHNM